MRDIIEYDDGQRFEHLQNVRCELGAIAYAVYPSHTQYMNDTLGFSDTHKDGKKGMSAKGLSRSDTNGKWKASYRYPVNMLDLPASLAHYELGFTQWIDVTFQHYSFTRKPPYVITRKSRKPHYDLSDVNAEAFAKYALWQIGVEDIVVAMVLAQLGGKSVFSSKDAFMILKTWYLRKMEIERYEYGCIVNRYKPDWKKINIETGTLNREWAKQCAGYRDIALQRLVLTTRTPGTKDLLAPPMPVKQ